MNKEATKYDLFDEIRQQSKSYRTPVPVHTWSRLESRLDNKESNKRNSFYKFFYNAAMITMAVAMIAFIAIYIQPWKVLNKQVDSYAQNIEVLKSTANTYPVYNVHKLQAAYNKLEISNNTSFLKELKAGSTQLLSN